MKASLIFLLIITVYSCTNKSLPQKLIPDEYNFPETKIELGKTLIYLNRNSGDTTYLDLFHSIFNEKTFLIQCSYDKNSVSDSIIFIDKRPVDYYINPFGKGGLWKANKISDTAIKDEKGMLNEVSEFQWKKDSNYVVVKSRNWIVKDTVLQWKDKPYAALITNTIIETNSNFLRTPDGNYNFKMEVINYLCKDIGSVRRLLICSWNAKPIVTELIDIRNKKN